MYPGNTYELVFVTRNVGDVHVVGRGTDILLECHVNGCIKIASTAINLPIFCQ
jgi:hypothetical protein